MIQRAPPGGGMLTESLHYAAVAFDLLRNHVELDQRDGD
jgi:hypothetical protein